MKNNTMNICNTCKYSLPECESKFDDVIYGSGKGNDNVVECKHYKIKETFHKDCCPNCGCDVFAPHDLCQFVCCRCFEIY